MAIPGEGPDRLPVFREEQIVAPACQGPVLGGVVTGQGLLVAAEHFGDLHDV